MFKVVHYILQTWDLALARTARAWGERCIIQKNYFVWLNRSSHPDLKFNPPGENIWIANAGRKPFDPTRSIMSWYSEVAFYQYHNNTCKGQCSHYIQVIFIFLCSVCTSDSKASRTVFLLVVGNSGDPMGVSKQQMFRGDLPLPGSMARP